MKLGLLLVVLGLSYIVSLVYIILVNMPQDWWLAVVLVATATIGAIWKYRQEVKEK